MGKLKENLCVNTGPRQDAGAKASYQPSRGYIYKLCNCYSSTFYSCQTVCKELFSVLYLVSDTEKQVQHTDRITKHPEIMSKEITKGKTGGLAEELGGAIQV